MENINNLRNIILTLSGIGAFLAIYINFSSNFFLEIIKSRFKNGPIKNLSIKVIITWIILLIALIDIIFIAAFIMNMFTNKTSLKDVNIFNGNASLSVTIMALVLLISLLSPIIIWNKVKDSFIFKLINNKEKKIGKFIKIINLSGVFSSFIWSATMIIIIGVSIYQGIKIDGNIVEFILILDKETLIYGMIIIFFNTTAFIISYSLCEAIKSIEEKYKYVLKGSKNICCMNYLDYEEFYLVFDKDKERYIRKSDIKEILKIKNNQRKKQKSKFIKTIINKLQINIKVKRIRYGNIVIWGKNKIIYNVVLYINNESDFLGIVIKEGIKPSKLSTSEVCKFKNILNLENKELDFENETSRYKSFLRRKEYIVKIK